MSVLINIVIGIVIGMILGWYFFKWLKKISEKKLLSKLEKGINESGLDFLKFKETERRKEDERKQIDREAIIRELLGREHKVESSSGGVNKDTFYERVTGDVIERNEVQGVVSDEHNEHKSRDRQIETGNKPNRKWVNI